MRPARCARVWRAAGVGQQGTSGCSQEQTEELHGCDLGPQGVDAPMQGAGKAPASPAPSMRRRVALRPAPGARLGAQRARSVAQAPARGRERGGRALQALLHLLRGLDEEQVARLRLRERLQQLPRLLRPARRRSGQPSG